MPPIHLTEPAHAGEFEPFLHSIEGQAGLPGLETGLATHSARWASTSRGVFDQARIRMGGDEMLGTQHHPLAEGKLDASFVQLIDIPTKKEAGLLLTR